jgi:hypothetical protein
LKAIEKERSSKKTAKSRERFTTVHDKKLLMLCEEEECAPIRVGRFSKVTSLLGAFWELRMVFLAFY